jgi:small subunit ribosomal protein S2
VAILDTNVDPSGIAFPIPGNDDASRAVRLYCDSVAQAATTGRTEGVVDSGADFGAMEAPPEEAAIVEEPVAAEEPAAEPVSEPAPELTEAPAPEPAEDETAAQA